MMSIRRGMIAFGMSAAIATGGVVAGKEAFDQAERLATIKACDNNPEATQACDSMLINDETLKIAETGQTVYGIIGGASLIGASIGIMAAFEQVLMPTERARRREEEPEAS